MVDEEKEEKTIPYELFDKFYKKSVEERREVLAKVFGNDVVEKLYSPLSLDKADAMVENVVGIGTLPIGLVTTFKLNGKHYIVPMMIEEPSVIAAANKASKLTLPEGFKASATEPIMQGEIQLVVDDLDKAVKAVKARQHDIERLAKELTKNMEKYGGGWRGFELRRLETKRANYLLFVFDVNTASAMGANTVNTVAEGLAPLLEEITGGEARLRILTNLSIKRRVKVEALFHISREEAERFLDGYELAVNDIFRLATHSKGVMNGMDAAALATGQDWRAIEAAAHTYSLYKGGKPFTHFEIAEEHGQYVGLKGSIDVPIAVGTVGGAIKVLSHAQASLALLGNPDAATLAQIIAAIGLANNFAAIYALSTTGIQRGHMKLHARTLALSLGATPEEANNIANKAEQLLEKGERITMERVKRLLDELKQKGK